MISFAVAFIKKSVLDFKALDFLASDSVVLELQMPGFDVLDY